jgi:hypothetical protein
MYRELEPKTIPLTRELAEDVATMRGTPGERVLDKGRLAYLRGRFEEGAFHTPEWAVATLNGIRYRVNGQHSSNMLVSLNGTFPAGMRVSWKEFHCDSVEDLADLFSQFDAAKSARSLSDIVGAHASIHPEFSNIKKTYIQKAVSGIAYAMGLSKKLATNDDRAKLVHSHQAFIVWGSGFVRAKHLDRSPVVAAMYKTWSKSPSHATEFWTLVRDENHPDVDHPTRVLATFLRDNIVRESQTRVNRWSPQAFAAKSIHAWNAFRTNTRTALKCYDTEGWPEVK